MLRHKNSSILVLAIISMPMLAGCANTEAQRVKLQADHATRMMAPEWFKRSIVYHVDGFGDVHAYSSIRWGITALAVVAMIGFSCLESDFAGITVKVIATCEIGTLVVYVITWVFVFVFIGDYYIPTGLIACGFYVIVLVAMLFAIPAQLLAEHVNWRPELPDFRRTAVHAAVAVARPNKDKLTKIALRALVVAVITTLGSQLGGWLGGIVAIVIASVIASIIGGDSSHQSSNHVDHDL